ncbi:hypothetical protein HX004_02370 [Myroides sp. 1354]|nr:hypothetical protein [Myroides sp. R163-1]MDM1054630.1 hypothetical protein [Myroides sp. 1354]MDM1067927.1 hypothetical protein [Myroides sp. 1372]
MNSYFDFSPLFFGVFFILMMSSLIYSPIHSYLRKQNVFYALFILSIIGVIYACFQIKIGWEHKEILSALTPLLLLFYLLLYKIADVIALKIYKRHIYFSCRLSNYFSIKEAEESTWLEWFMQVAILFGSALLWLAVIEFVEGIVIV